MSAKDTARVWAARMDEAAIKGSHREVLDALRQHKDAGQATIAKAALWAYEYRVVVKFDDARAHIKIVPWLIMEDPESCIPPPVSNVSPEIVDAWELLAREVTSAFALARLNHALFECRRGNAGERARFAAEKYLEASARWQSEFDEAEDAQASLRLFRAVGDHQRFQQVAAQLSHRAKELLEGSPDKPGRFLAFVETLMVDGPARGLARLVLEEALAHEFSTHIRDRLLRLTLECEGVDREGLQTQVVQVWVEEAMRATGVLRITNLQTALARARAYSRPDLYSPVAAIMQRESQNDIGLMRISASTAVDRGLVESLIEDMESKESLADCLREFVALGPASGSPEANREQAREMASTSIFLRILQPQTLSDGMPRFAPATEADRQEMQLTEVESHRVEGVAPVWAEALLRIGQKYSATSDEEVSAALVELGIPEVHARQLGRCLLRFWGRDYEAAVYIGVTQVEALARKLLIELDVGVYRLQAEQRPGQYPGLGALLGALREKGLPEGWFRYLYTTLCNPAGGWNLRNEVTHGFVSSAPPPVAAVVMQQLLFLALVLSDLRYDEGENLPGQVE